MSSANPLQTDNPDQPQRIGDVACRAVVRATGTGRSRLRERVLRAGDSVIFSGRCTTLGVSAAAACFRAPLCRDRRRGVGCRPLTRGAEADIPGFPERSRAL